jgi:hypothetical protein
MHSHPRQSSLFAAFAAACLVAAIVHAAPQSDIPPGGASAAASQTALAIAAVAAMKSATAGAPAPRPAEAAPGDAATVANKLTAEQRQQFMLLLIMRETSRNPLGALR